MIQSRNIYTSLGRYGDIINVAPLYRHLHAQGKKPIVCVADEFKDVLDGVSYCEPLVYPGMYNDPPAALRWLKANRPKDFITICQKYRHPFDQETKTGSYQTETWRVAGFIDEWGKHPTVFDRRDPAREARLVDSISSDGRPLILVATESVSSPFPRAKALLSVLQCEFGHDHHVLDLASVRAERIYDLIGLYEKAACLVSVDTVHLHLARAARVPIVAIINDGYFGSVPPPGAIATVRYADSGDFNRIVEPICEVVAARRAHRFVVHVVNMHGGTDRHARARESWPAAYGDEEVVECFVPAGRERGDAIQDPRPLVKLKDMLTSGLARTTDDDDIVIWANSDVRLAPGCFEAMKEHAALFGAFTMRRHEPGTAGVHMGRELAGFRAGWLRARMADIPDFYIGAPCFDLILAAMIRLERGIISTVDNLSDDFYPCELPAGPAMHEAHPSNWAGEHELTYPANVWNQTFARQWCKKYCPSLKL